MKLVFGIKVLFDGQTVLLAQGYARKLHGLFEKLQLFAGQPFKQLQRLVGVFSGGDGKSELDSEFPFVDDHVLDFSMHSSRITVAPAAIAVCH